MAPPIVVLVPTRNRPAMLARALASIVRQTDPEWVAVVGDDGDAPAEPAVRALGSLDARVRFARSSFRTPGGARDAAFHLADRDGLVGAETLVALLDDDDEWLPEHLARARAALRASPSSPFSHARATTRTPAGGDSPYHAKDLGPFAGDLFVPLLSRDFVATSTVVARASALRAEGLFRADLTHGEDWDLCLKLSRRGPVALVDSPTAVHHVHEGNVSHAVVAKARCHVTVFEHWWRRRHRLEGFERKALRREAARRRARLVRRMATDASLPRREARREGFRQFAAQPGGRTLFAALAAALPLPRG